jgi:dTDP-4-dehydrorhamnose 3,5-epimerase
MRVEATDMHGFVEHREYLHEDSRGSFLKLLDRATTVSQVCVSHTKSRGTIRGLHVQVSPHPETKHVWCSTGRVFDVLVDTRGGEPTFGCWAAIELSGDDPRLITIPAGVAHGFQTLEDDVVLNYLIDGTYAPDSARTLRWNDPVVGIEWPLAATCMSDSDQAGLPWPVS